MQFRLLHRHEADPTALFFMAPGLFCQQQVFAREREQR